MHASALPPWPVDHIGLAVLDLELAIADYARIWGGSVSLREEVIGQGAEIAFIDLPNTKIELLAPLGLDTALGRFLAKRGPGLHHICYRVPDIGAEMDRLLRLGVKLIDKEPRPGANGTWIAFLQPKDLNGVLVELCQVAHK